MHFLSNADDLLRFCGNFVAKSGNTNTQVKFPVASHRSKLVRFRFKVFSSLFKTVQLISQRL